MSDPGASTGTKTNVFISYSRRDIAFVDRLAEALTFQGIAPAIDRAEIYAFEDWWKRIEALIGAADTVIFVLSPDAIASDICRREVECAQKLAKRFAPIVCRSVAAEMEKIPPALANLNFIFFDAPEAFDPALEKLVEALTIDIAWVRLHTEYGLDAAEWQRAQRPGGLLLRSPRLEEAERWIATRPPGAPPPSEATQAFVLASRHGATQRRNLVTGSLAAGLVLSLGLAGVALWQRGEAIAQRQAAEQQRQAAERNFVAAKTTVDGLIFNIAQGFQDVAGMRKETIRKILETVRATVDRLLESNPTDVRLLHSKATMLDNFAATYRAAGDLSSAMSAAIESIEIRLRMVRQDPGDRQRAEALTISLTTLGDLKQQGGDPAGALRVYGQSLDIVRALGRRGPQRGEAVCLQRIGQMKLVTGDTSGALAAYENALAIALELADANPADVQAQRDVSVGLIQIGDAKMQAGMGAGAIGAFSSSLAIARKLAVNDPGNVQLHGDVSLVLAKIGGARRQAGDQAGSLAAFEEALVIDRKLAAQDAGNAQLHRSLSSSLLDVGDAKREASDRPGALAAYEEALAIRRGLATRDKSNDAAARDLAVSLVKLGDLRGHAGETGDDLAGASAAYEESLAITRRLARREPGSTTAQRDLALGLARIGDVKRRKGDTAAAIAAQDEALVVARRLAEKDSGNATAQRDLAVNLNAIGDMFLDKADHAGALEAYEQALAIVRKLAAREPHNALSQKDLSSGLRRIGDAKHRADDRAGALAAYQDALSIARRLARQEAKDDESHWLLFTALTRVGSLSPAPDAFNREALELGASMEAAGHFAHDRKTALDTLRTAVAAGKERRP